MEPERADVLIVGAGPAGLAAAIELKRLGVRDVILVDRELEAGGIPRLCHHAGFGLRDLRGMYSGPGYARRYVRQAEAAAIEMRTSTTIMGWQGPTRVNFTSPRGLGQIEARAILLATGCRERPRAARLVPGGRPQGVFTTGSLQRFVYQRRLPVGKRAVIVGAELVSLSALMTLLHARVSAAAMVTELPEHQIYFPYRPAKWYFADVLARTPVMTGARLSRILGRGRVEGVEITHLDSGQTELIACDTVVFTGDWIPEHELARLGGLAVDPGTRGPRVDSGFRTSAQGVFAAGNLLHGAETADVSALEGRHAARRIHEFLSHGLWPARILPIQVDKPLAWVFPNAVSAANSQPPVASFTFRVHEFCTNARVLVCQGERTLHTQTFRRLQPNASMRLDSRWLGSVNVEGEALSLVLTR
ncbi:MAG TPA: FAD-dependent oxidoreductase [Anaerolineales bacterium]|nr:FAD-dependent oxidoreductase [Anaerolineales bacterium]